MKQNSLKINQDKTEYIIFSSKPDQYKHISLTVGRDIILPSEYVRILGVTLDSQMNMHQHIANTCRSAYMHIRKINSIRQFLCKNSTTSLVSATVLTRFLTRLTIATVSTRVFHKNQCTNCNLPRTQLQD